MRGGGGADGVQAVTLDVQLWIITENPVLVERDPSRAVQIALDAGQGGDAVFFQMPSLLIGLATWAQVIGLRIVAAGGAGGHPSMIVNMHITVQDT